MSGSKTSTAAVKPDHGADLGRMRRPPTHPGEMFEEEFRKPSGISQAEAARRMGMSSNRLNEIVAGKRGVTAQTAVLMGTLTGTDPRVWLHLQADYDLWHALRSTETKTVAAIAGGPRGPQRNRATSAKG